MKSVAARVLSALGFAVATSCAQTFAQSPNAAAGQAAQLQELTKKIDEQNAKIDMLSQQILKLQIEVTHQRPGVMIGEGAPATSTATSTSSATPEPSAKTGNG